MDHSRVRRVMALFGKEMRRRQASFGTSYMLNIVIIAVAFVSYLLLSWHPVWPSQLVIMVLDWFIIITPVMVLLVSLEVWSYEWEENHRDLLLALPLSGRTIVGVKAATVVFDILTFLVSIKLLLLLFAWMDPDVLQVFHPDGTMVAGGALSTLMGFTVTVALVTLAVTFVSQFAWLVGALVPRFHVYVGMVAFAVGVWLMFRAAAAAEQLAAWFPRVDWWMVAGVSSFRQEDGGTTLTVSAEPGVVELSTAPLTAMVLVGVVLYGVAAHIVEEQLEA